ncbi:hypothetical protein RvY_06470 [Ramazzottius varieornatus]|uniref:Odorant receptor n=1 Tax=Ramazzottius varieornatus TaxID=947166 RepID=A0A1D1V8A4_RAMVA|nr:hypothetical protein RvY_06470 [Ramazzottius varieornatus]
MLRMGLFVVQEYFLRAWGILPVDLSKDSSQTKQKCFSWVSLVLGVTLLLGSFYQSAVQCAVVVCGIISSAGVFKLTNNGDATLLTVLADLPFCCIHLRGFLVITLTFFNRHKWMDLKVSFRHLVQTSFPNETQRLRILDKWKKRSAWFAVLTFVGHILWESGDWLYYSTVFPRTYAMNASSLLSPLPLKITTWQYLILYTLFCIVPFILSQQVFICLIVMAGVLMNALKELRHSIAQCSHELLENNYRKTTCCFKAHGSSAKYGNVLDEMIAEKVNMWQIRHMETLVFLRQLNKFFNWMLFVIYGLDFMTCLGFAAHVANNTSTVIESHVFLLFSAFVFAAYATVFLIPLVAVFEHVSHSSETGR